MMKKILLAFLLATASMATFTSCTKEYYDMVPSKTFIYERTASQWGGSDNSATLTLNIPELTQYYINQGIVSVAISTNNEVVYQTIPATINGVAYSYDYSLGRIVLYAEDPIMRDDSFVDVPSNVVIKVSLTDADFVE